MTRKFTTSTQDWARYYEAQKKVFFDPDIPVVVKAVIKVVELYRSDGEGWNISVRTIEKNLGISHNTAIKAVNEAIRLGLIQTSNSNQRVKRKLKLSGSLRAPVGNLYQIVNQPGSKFRPQSGAKNEPVNIKYNNQLNNATDVSKTENTKDPYESENYKRLREKVELLRSKLSFPTNNDPTVIAALAKEQL